MFKVGYIIALLSGIGVFNSCTAGFINPTIKQSHNYEVAETSYGNYLAGRVAHIRQDYDKASSYYVGAIEKGFVNNDLLSRTYILLASQGNIKKAYEYANLARKNGDDTNFIEVINAVYHFKNGNYRLAISNFNKIEEKTYYKFISPLFCAWAYAGEGNYEQAIIILNKLSKIKEFEVVYNLHAGLISEHFNRIDEAEKYYEAVINDTTNDLSFRALQIICNFLVRNGKKNQAEHIVSKYYGSSNIKEMLSSLSETIKQEKKTAKPVIKNVDDGISEVFLEIALLFKSVPVGYDYAQMYIAISQYFNPNNDVAKIAMADIYEEFLLLDKANEYYNKIKDDSELYYPAQMSKARNLIEEKKHSEAIKVLKKLLRKDYNNFQVFLNLGDALRVSDNQPEAIKYYNKAIDSIFYEDEKHWPVYYALAVSYDKNNQWLDAEKSLKRALVLSNRHPQVLNYLGYSWLKYGINLEDATEMILEAFEKEPNDSVILDSVGWLYFKTGDYKNAISFLERASELNPQNAVISDHLGDAYWQGGRKNEARFLWSRALKQESYGEEINAKNVKSKIENGLNDTQTLTLKNEKVYEELKQLEYVTN